MMSVELRRYLMASNILTAELFTGSPQPLMQCAGCCQLAVLHLADRASLSSIFEDYKLKNTVWLTFLDSGQSLQEFVGETNIRFDVQFLVAQPADTAVRLFEVYRVTSDTPLCIRLFGAFGQPHGIPLWKYVYYRRRSFEGHVMKTASLNDSFLVSVNKNKIGGLYGQLWGMMEDHLNFTSQVFVPAIGMWGYKEANGTWNGVIGMVNRGEVDVGVCDVAMTAERVPLVSYSMQVATFHYKAFVRIGDVDVSWGSFLRPLNTRLWVVMAACTVTMAVTLRICFQVLSGVGEELRTDTRLQDLVFATFGAVFCLQGQSRTPLTVQCRLVYILSYTLGVVLLCAYSAAIISFLTVHKPDLHITTLEQLHQEKTYTVRAERGSSTLEAFRLATEHPLYTLYKERMQPYLADMPRSVLEGLQRLCQVKRFVLMVPVEEAAKHVQHLSCAIVYLPEGLYTLSFAFIFNKRSPYTGIFRYILQKLQEAGIMKKLQEDTMRYEPQTLEAAFKSIQLVDVAPIFSILALGIVMTVFVVLIERLVTP